MKKLLLFAGLSAVGLAVFAAEGEPQKIDNVYFQKLSANGKYAVSVLSETKIEIMNLESGEKYTYTASGDDEIYYYAGIGKSISNDGVMVGGETSKSAEYWKDGEWYYLDLPENAVYSNTANAITSDGSRICGMIGVGGVSYDDDVLMTVPCIWNAEGDGYGEPMILPYPTTDFTGRTPQYVKAIDISADGKTIVGMITDATGFFNYPILYKEDGEGKWSYEIPHSDLLMPAGMDIPKYPGDFKIPYPSYEDYMTPAELDQYNEATNNYYQEGDYTKPYPEPVDFMTAENKEEYEKIMAEYNKEYQAWDVKYMEWQEAILMIQEFAPSYSNNSTCISNDGLTYGCTLSEGGGFWGGQATYNVWLFDVNDDNIYKYDQNDSLCLSYIADGGIGVASTPVSTFFNTIPSNSFILKDGECIGMYDWMASKKPAYASWMKENMTFEYESYDDDWNEVLAEELMTGHAISTPDLSKMVLSVQNIGFPEDESAWEDEDYESPIGYGFIFDLSAGSAVESICPVSSEQTIYDLSGRRLKNATAPGIYIINGEKKAVR